MMKDTSVFVAMTMACPGVLFGPLWVSRSHTKTGLIVIFISVVLFVSGWAANRGGTLWFLRMALVGAFMAFLFSGAPASIMEGGIFTIPHFFVLSTGAITSLCARRHKF